MNFWHYLLLVNIYLVLFYGFYVLMLKMETFFQLNRIYLIMAALLSFFIPVIQSNWVKNLFITKTVQYSIYSSPVMVYRFKPAQPTHISVEQIVLAVYLIGSVFLLARFVWQLLKLKKLIADPQSEFAWSFFRKIKLGHDVKNRNTIAAHEHVHALQLHSMDVLLMEIVLIFSWFNPVVYFYRIAIKHIHEFIADSHALKMGTDKAEYALILLSQTFNAPVNHLVNPFFNHSLLKQRIMMLQKKRSNYAALMKYCLSAPLFIIMLIFSSATVNTAKTLHFINKKVGQVFSATVPPVIRPGKLTINRPAVLVSKKTNIDSDVEVKITAAPVPKADTPRTGKRMVFTSVEHIAEFPGGITEFSQFLAKNTHYPADSRNKGIQGRVIISFVVETDGSLSNIHIARGVAPDIDEEALRVIKLSPKWAPGRQNGIPVRVAYSVPISFTLPGGIDPFSMGEKKTGEIKTPENTLNNHLAANKPVLSLVDTSKLTNLNLTANYKAAPIYIIDGKEASSMDYLNPSDIKSISVLKNKPATDLYGPKGINGVIVIDTKKNISIKYIRR
jgi:TonB family protein